MSVKRYLKKIMGRGRKWVSERPGLTFCQVMREVYHTTEDKEVRSKCELAVLEAKKIVGELKKNREMFYKDHKKDVKERKMGIRKHNPVSVKKIENPRYQGHHTICQFLRDIYSMTNNEDIKLKCRIGMSMAKSMHERLKKYRKIMNGSIVAKVEGDEIKLEKIHKPK